MGNLLDQRSYTVQSVSQVALPEPNSSSVKHQEGRGVLGLKMDPCVNLMFEVTKKDVGHSRSARRPDSSGSHSRSNSDPRRSSLSPNLLFHFKTFISFLYLTKDI